MDATKRVRMLSTQVEARPLGCLGEGLEYDIPEELARRWHALGLARIVEPKPVASPMVSDSVGDTGDAPAGELVQEREVAAPPPEHVERPHGTRAKRRK